MTQPFQIITARTPQPLIIFGDHASRHIPSDLDNLGLTGKDLTRHIAWDIGTDTVVRELCAHFGCHGHLAGVSRLVIDMNRGLGYDGLIPEESDETRIIGNIGLTEQARQDRINRYYNPYHHTLGNSLDAMGEPFVISVHSFTRRLVSGDRRTIDVGLLVKHDEPSGHAFYKSLSECVPGLELGINEPYSAYILNHTIDTHIAPRGLRHLAIEIGQDHIDTEDKAVAMAKKLAPCLETVIYPDGLPSGSE